MKLFFNRTMAAVLAIGVLGALPSRSDAQPIPLSVTSPYFRDKSVTLSISNSSLGKVVETLGKEHKANILTDSFARDFVLEPKWEIKNVPLGEFEQTLSEVFIRDLFKSGDIAVLKSRATLFNLELNAPLRQKIKSTNSTPVTFFTEDDVPLTPTQPAAARIGIRATDVPLGELMDELQARVGWKVDLDEPLRARRVNLDLNRVTIGDFADAVAVLTNSGTIKSKSGVEILQSAQQKQEEAKATREFSEFMESVRPGSSAIMKQLYPLLSEKQIATLKQEGHVEIPVASLPAPVQKSALQYIKTISKRLETLGVPYQVSKDYDQFSLSLANRLMNGVGIDGTDVNGGLVGF